MCPMCVPIWLIYDTKKKETNAFLGHYKSMKLKHVWHMPDSYTQQENMANQCVNMQSHLPDLRGRNVPAYAEYAHM